MKIDLTSHHLGIAACWEIALLVEDIGNTAAHPRCEIASGFTQDDDLSACHVFATVVADRFYYSTHPRVADAETFASHVVDVDFAPGGSVEGDVADDDVFGGDTSGTGIQMADIMVQPRVTRGAVEKPNYSAPRRAAIAMSRPVLSWPSVSTTMRLRRLLRTRV
jgi:hypothetical protein